MYFTSSFEFWSSIWETSQILIVTAGSTGCQAKNITSYKRYIYNIVDNSPAIRVIQDSHILCLYVDGIYLDIGRRYLAGLVCRAAAIALRWRGVQRRGLALTTLLVSGRDLAE